ncbi:hypothetical protein [Fulvivirga ligni]|uniref:hypothetical protein n=1 Tax=Fulvivirga ligni TaxID=2904246 RepID=UPI001F276B9F|nr:hypothetical protein [Fulvivirga ligni]UII19878.1 hypothetical protein LVD16_18710 [Fulvivirga ligni]
MDTKMASRVDRLESEILKYKRTTIIALVFSIICGGGGLLGLATWLTNIPKHNKETQKIALEIVKDSLEISMKRFTEVQTKHNSEIESISRQLDLNKSMGNSDQVQVLTSLLIVKEQQFQSLITTTSEMCKAIALKAGGTEQWMQKYLTRMESIKQESVTVQAELEQLK